MRPAAMHAAAVTLLVLTGACGCVQPGRGDDDPAQLLDARDQLEASRKEVAELKGQLARRDEQIRTLRGLGAKRLEHLFHVQRIRLGRYTGGADMNDQPGDDGIKVFCEPVDRHGSVLKAAGAVTVQLFDLAAPPARSKIFEKTWPVETIHKAWSGGLLGGHYRLECRWPAPPAHDEITVRVEFLDYLTGDRFTAQKLCKITLPPPPTTAPGR